MITLDGVHVRAGAFRLTDISFTIPAGAFGVVVGPAGSGKTTMLEAIAGVAQVTSGRVSLHEHTVTDWPPEKRGVGLMYQHSALFPHRSVRENIGWASDDNSIVRPIVERLGINKLLATPVSSLSGGERQLVALARALVRVRSCHARNESSVLLLDEPYSALDPRRRVVTRDIVRSLHREWALTTLMVTHDSADARRADIAVLLDDGRIMQSGVPDAMLAAPARDDVAYFLSGEI